ncbi:MAG: hypothetical protein Q3976_00880 [Corynebacterium sp.]|nr:hypothetical protein [Corynebacterium sp.]
MIVLIDGRSGSGKTTLAAKLAAATDFHVVHLDDFYPGWRGLRAGSLMVAQEVIPHRRFQRWDWGQNQAGPWEELPAGNLIIEGAGAWSAEAEAALRDEVYLSVVVSAPAKVRKAKALARDPYYAPYWQQWSEQEDAHFAGQPAADLYLGIAEEPAVAQCPGLETGSAAVNAILKKLHALQ